MLLDGISRKQLQALAIQTLLDANTLAGDHVFEARDWPTRPELFPLLTVQTPHDRKVSRGPGTMQFNTTIALVVVGRVSEATPEATNEALDVLAGQVENALMCTLAFIRNVQQITTVETTTVVTSETKRHVGQMGMVLECEVYQAFAPDGGVPLTGVQGTITSAGNTLATVKVGLPFTS